LILVRIEALCQSFGGGVTNRCSHIFDDIISVKNLLISWEEFLCGKRKRKDVEEFTVDLMDNILLLHHELNDRTYRHGSYYAFKINDPKPRDIHKASVKDRIVHHAIYRILYPYFDNFFIFDSYSCRLNKGTHRAINQLHNFADRISKNDTKTVWILKGDIQRFFANIDHNILLNLLRKRISNTNIIWLLERVIDSFHTSKRKGVGLPLGNLTSQLFTNIYMNEFDQFVKRQLKVRCYIRYADDFIILHDNKIHLKKLVGPLSKFLESGLGLKIHPNKIFIKTLDSGVDFLGWINFSRHRVLRTKTKRRMLRRLEDNNYLDQSVSSYLGLLQHGNAFELSKSIRKRLS